MIDVNKKYRTRDGRKVRIYAVDGGAPHPVHGAIKLDDGDWELVAWRGNGRLGGHSETDSDLIEVKPRIVREVWVNVYPSDWEMTEATHRSKEDADRHADVENRIACVKLVIDVEEGEGL